MQRVHQFHFSEEAFWSQEFCNSAKFWWGALPGKLGRGFLLQRKIHRMKKVEFVSAKTGRKGQKNPHLIGWLVTLSRNDKVFIEIRHCVVSKGLLQWQQTKPHGPHLPLTGWDDHTTFSPLVGVCSCTYRTILNYLTDPRHFVLLIFVFSVSSWIWHKEGVCSTEMDYFSPPFSPRCFFPYARIFDRHL